MTASSPTAPPIGEGTRCRWFSLTGTTRTLRFVVVLAVLGGLPSACSRSGAGAAAPVLGWYVNPDNGGQAELAAARTAASGGRYRITGSPLPHSAPGQRGQLVPRPAAEDPPTAPMRPDPP